MKNFLRKTIQVVVAVAMLAVPFGTRAGTTDIFKGWAWSSAIGWISMNSSNCSAATCSGAVAAYSYGVTIDASRNLTGYAWSPNVGWMCFGSTCGAVTAPDGASSWAALGSDQYTPQVYGWARALSYATGNDGWISFNCQSDGVHAVRNTCAAHSYYVYTTLNTIGTPNYDGQFQGYAFNCSGVSNGTQCTAANYASGFGWIHFSPNYAQTGVPTNGTYGGVPWVQVLYGDLYSKGRISTPSPFTTTFAQTNATYCIDSGLGASGITNFTNDLSKCSSGTLSPNISLPKKGSNYSNTLGRIKLRGYTTYTANGDPTKNGLFPINYDTSASSPLVLQKYGPWGNITNANISNLPAPPFLTTDGALGGAVYDTVTHSGAWVMGATTFKNATGTGSGAGLLIVRGNLEISGNVVYGGGTITNLKQLASLGILVLDDGAGHPGNITIDSNVTEIDANIYAEGEISTGTTNDPKTEAALKINGVVVAKQFNFQRNYQGGANQPSEQIVNDGRIVVNTPPGMNDFIASLPAVSY
jgi:hypothetical protein